MVYSKLTSVLYAVAFLATKSVAVEGSQVLELVPELKGQGPAEVAYVDPDTHRMVIEYVDENGKGTIEKRQRKITRFMHIRR
jgi:hypothetical protein